MILLGQVQITSSNDGLSVGGTPTTVTTGDWYVWHPTPASSYLDHLVGVINAEATPTVTYSVDSDGYLTLTCDSSTVALTDLQCYAILGYASDSVTITTGGVTATRRLQASWVSGRELTSSLSPGLGGSNEQLATQVQGPDKTLYTTLLGELSSEKFRWDYLARARTWAEGSAARASAQEWWQECGRLGLQFVVLPAWTGSGGSYSTPADYAVDLNKTKAFLPVPNQAGSRTWWSWTIEARGL